MKETFIIRTEWYKAIGKLPPEDQAVIFRNLFEYHAGNMEGIQTPTLAVEVVWEIIEPQLKRHIESYDKRCETSKENGKKGGRPAKPKKPNPEPNKPNHNLNNHDTESDCENDSVSDNGSVSDKKFAFRENVKLKKAEYGRLEQELGHDFLEGLLDFYRDYKKEKNPKTKDDNLTIRRWVIDAYREKVQKQAKVVGIQVKSGFNPLDRKHYYSEEEYQKAVAKHNSTKTA